MSGTNEVRVTNETTGGQKGSKDERYDLIPVGPLAQVARHYGVGAAKYDDNNWRKGYDWSLSYAALQRHAQAFWGGEDIDSETQSHHMAAVVFHALALLEFAETHPELDDRCVEGQSFDDEVEAQLEVSPLIVAVQGNLKRILERARERAQVGQVATSGASTGPHLHFEMPTLPPIDFGNIPPMSFYDEPEVARFEPGQRVRHQMACRDFDGTGSATGTVVRDDGPRAVLVEWDDDVYAIGGQTIVAFQENLEALPEPKYRPGDRVSVRDVARAIRDGGTTVALGVAPEGRPGLMKQLLRVPMTANPEGDVTTIVSILDALEECGYQVTKA